MYKFEGVFGLTSFPEVEQLLRQEFRLIEEALSFGEWINADLGNNWIDYGTPYAPVGYTSNGQGVVMLRGMAKDGTTTAGTVIFTLPTDLRPAYEILQEVASHGNGHGEIAIHPDGTVSVENVTGADYLSFNGVMFLAGS